MSPSQIGPYLIEKKIGAGGMGTVYLGHHEETEQRAAVKVLPASLAREDGFVIRFTREIDSLKQLKNPHVVELYESGIEGDLYYYAMEYVEGQTLADLLKEKRRLPWKDAIAIAVQVCTALKAAHNAGIIHRDLKPSNLLIAPDGFVKLMDFGVAQVFAASKLTATGGIIGTAEFMSPEQASGRRATKVSDLYSLGAVIYAMLTGQPPFSGKTTVDIIQKHRFGRFDPARSLVPEIPHWLDAIVCQLLEKEPEKRFPDAYVLSLRLQEVVKKVELSQRDPLTAGDDYDGIAQTVAISETPQGGPGGGTLMRDLMRAELELASKPSALGSLLNNTVFLVVSLVLLIAGGVWWFRAAGPPSGIERGQEMGVTPNGVFEQSLARARHFAQMGDTPRAKRLLSAQLARLEGESEHSGLYNRTKLQLQRLQKNLQNRNRVIESEMAKASQLADAGQHGEARKIWTYIVEAHEADQDTTVRNFVNTARQSLDESGKTESAGTAKTD